ncbi:MAG: hypothetical protein RJQ21_16805 [Rhodospirillales bacterium]
MVFGTGLVLLLMVVVGVSPLLLPYDAETMSGDAILAPPSASHWAGTDHLGRDLLARALLGGRTTLGLALLARRIHPRLGREARPPAPLAVGEPAQ